jgi:predicted component of type VI protein secretion system
MWGSLIPNFTHIGQEIWKVRVKIHLRLAVTQLDEALRYKPEGCGFD